MVCESMPLDLLLMLLARERERGPMLRSWLFTRFGPREDEEAFLESQAAWLEGARWRLLRQAVVAMDCLREERERRDRRAEEAAAEVLKAFRSSPQAL